MATRGQMNRRQKTRDESGSLLDKMLEGSGVGSIRAENKKKASEYRRKKAMESVPGIETSRTRAAENKRKADDVKRVRAATEANRTADKMDSFMKEVEAESSKRKTGRMAGEPRSIAEARKMGKDYFIGKDGKRKAAVTKEELDKSGMSLREFLNKKKGKTARMAKGGMANCGASVPPAQKSSKGNK